MSNKLSDGDTNATANSQDCSDRHKLEQFNNEYMGLQQVKCHAACCYILTKWSLIERSMHCKNPADKGWVERAVYVLPLSHWKLFKFKQQHTTLLVVFWLNGDCPQGLEPWQWPWIFWGAKQTAIWKNGVCSICKVWTICAWVDMSERIANVFSNST